MGRKRSTDLMGRDRLILEQRAEGKSLQELADDHNLSVGRISQILSVQDAAVSPEASRVEQRIQIQRIIDYKLLPIAMGPGRPMYANGNGQLIVDKNTGEQIYDEAICLDAADRIFRGYERISKLYAVDLPKQKDSGPDPQALAATEYFEVMKGQIIALKAQLARREALAIPEADVVGE